MIYILHTVSLLLMITIIYVWEHVKPGADFYWSVFFCKAIMSLIGYVCADTFFRILG